MKKLTVLACAAALVFAIGGAAVADDDDDDDNGLISDFALFDGTSPANLTDNTVTVPPSPGAGVSTGVLCGVSNEDGTALEPGEPFTYYFSVTSQPPATAPSATSRCLVRYTDGDFVQYRVPVDSSLSISQAGGAGVFDAAVRLECTQGFSGAGSILRANDDDDASAFCISCDGPLTGDVACDAIIPN